MPTGLAVGASKVWNPWSWEKKKKRKEAWKSRLDVLLSKPQGFASKEETIEILREMSANNPTRFPAKCRKLLGRWKLLWSSQTSNPFFMSDNVLGGYSIQDIFTKEGNLRVENSVIWPFLDLRLLGGASLMLDEEDRSLSSFKLRIDAFSLQWNEKEFPLLGSVLGTPRMTVRDGPKGRRRVLNRREGSVQILYLDDTTRITVSNSGLLFLHERMGPQDEDLEKT